MEKENLEKTQLVLNNLIQSYNDFYNEVTNCQSSVDSLLQIARTSNISDSMEIKNNYAEVDFKVSCLIKRSQEKDLEFLLLSEKILKIDETYFSIKMLDSLKDLNLQRFEVQRNLLMMQDNVKNVKNQLLHENNINGYWNGSKKAVFIGSLTILIVLSYGFFRSFILFEG